MMLGVGPYITSSIIMQLLTIMFPRMKAMYQEEGEAGRAKFTQWSRILTIPFALIQAFSFLILFSRQGVVDISNPFEFIVNALVIATGSIFLMWLGELMTEYGVGNGVSMIIFAGIVSAIPTGLFNLISVFDPSQIPLYIAFIAVGIAVIYAVVVVTEAERPIPVTYAKQVRGTKVFGGTSTYLPLRVNQAGVIPIIFALSFLLFPQMLFNFLAASTNATLNTISSIGLSIINNPWLYDSAYFLLVFAFTYFYTAITFDPIMISDNLQKSGAFVPGVRPGQPTAEYLSKVVTRITLVGALFLGFIAVLPLLMRSLTGITTVAVGGTALLIVVSVVLDLVKKVDAQIQMREY
jgi:preprotein translocase subunit SecY